MSQSEFVRWLALRKKNGPFGWTRLNDLVASVCFWIWRMNVYDPDGDFSETGPKDFLTTYTSAEERKPKTREEFIAEKVMQTRIFVTAVGGRIVGRD